MEEKKQITVVSLLKFLVPSLLGILLLLVPMKIEGKSTVLVSVVSNAIQTGINAVIGIEWIIVAIIVISTILGIVYKLAKPEFITKSEILLDVSERSVFWLIVRIIGCAFVIMTAFKIGPEIIISEDTGGLILFELIGGLFAIFLLAGFILPLLTEFGLLEYAGVWLSGIMRPWFKLPGRSALVCIASWLGDGTIGVALVNKEYQEGYYTTREASIIATTFTAVSITFCLVVLEITKLTDYFAVFYGVVGLAGIVCAIILPRIPPLSLKPNTFIAENKQSTSETVPEGFTKHSWGMQLALTKAEENFNIPQYLKSGTKTVLGLWFGVLPTIMAVGTLAVIISTYTPVFNWLGIPFRPLLTLLQVPEAEAVSKTIVVGFADMVVPAVMIADVPNQMTRFVVVAVSTVQVLYLSETGAVILGTSLPLNVLDLFIIFILRTLISLPVIALFAHLIF